MASVLSANFHKMKSFIAPLFISPLVLFSAFTSNAETLPQVHVATPTETVITQAPAPLTNGFVTLCYHDVSNGFVGNDYSIRKKDLIEQFEYLKNHYNVVSLQQVLEASEGKKDLPPKAVLLTFDDGLSSFHEIVFPLLKTYKFKAVFAIVGQWTENGAAPDYGFKDSNPKMATWKQLKEMAHSGYVDVVSHTYNMHQGQLINPQGNQAAMAGYYNYNSVNKTYESDEAFTTRVQQDLAKNEELITKHVGKHSPVIVWPYGAYNGLSFAAAKNVGLTMQMTLRPGLTYANDLSIIRRGLILSDMDIPMFASVIEKAFVDTAPLRMIRVDLDSIWKSKESETEQQLGDLLEQTLDLGVNGVLLQAVSDSGEAYFPTKELKVRGDYVNRGAHTLKNRAKVRYVYARLPQSVLRNTDTAKAMIRDLARHSDIEGVFFAVPSKDAVKEIDFDAIMDAAKEIRPQWQFGFIGSPLNPALFDYVILPTTQLADNSPLKTELKSAKVVVALPQDYKSDAAHMLAQGYLNLFYDVNFKSIVPDIDFRNVFSVRHASSKPSKGEAK